MTLDFSPPVPFMEINNLARNKTQDKKKWILAIIHRITPLNLHHNEEKYINNTKINKESSSKDTPRLKISVNNKQQDVRSKENQTQNRNELQLRLKEVQTVLRSTKISSI